MNQQPIPAGAEPAITLIPGTGTLLSQLQAQGHYFPAICGGRGSCGKCRVQVIAGNIEQSAADRACFSPEELAAGYRLACAAYPREELTIRLPRNAEGNFQGLHHFDIADVLVNRLRGEPFPLERRGLSFARQIGGPQSLGTLRELAKLADIQAAGLSGSNAGSGADSGGGVEEPVYCYWDGDRIVHINRGQRALYGVAVDIGTTTIALALADLGTGSILGRHSMVNKQREFGADVISRIQRANTGDLDTLSRTVRTQIAQETAALCQKSGIPERSVVKMAVAANTTMLHLLLGLNCNTLGQAPFTPVTLDFVTFPYGELFEGDLSCEVTILPGISTYVGADIAAGILCADLDEERDPVLFMDIGTNGEIALIREGRILCTATAAGPAFEGGNIRWGTGGVSGAIAAVTYQDGGFAIRTIEDQPPIGLCGSAVVDIVYQGLRNGLIQPDGAFNADRGIRELWIARTTDGRDITFCQKDVRELQLAKSAIRSGIDALIHHCAMDAGAIKTLVIAGGFGYNLNFDSGAGIGLIPPILKSRVRLVGNSALGGAVKYLLNRDAGARLNHLIEGAQEYSLPEDPYFSERFIENIEFSEE